MKIRTTQTINIANLLDEFFADHSEIESWLKVIYFLMFQKGITSFNIDEKHLEIYVENGTINILYSSKEDQEKNESL